MCVKQGFVHCQNFILGKTMHFELKASFVIRVTIAFRSTKDQEYVDQICLRVYHSGSGKRLK